MWLTTGIYGFGAYHKFIYLNSEKKFRAQRRAQFVPVNVHVRFMNVNLIWLSQVPALIPDVEKFPVLCWNAQEA